MRSKQYRIWRRFTHAQALAALVALWSAISGAALVIDIASSITVSVTMAQVPGVVRLWVAIAMLVGGLMATAGVLGDWERLDHSWRVEKAGWLLLIGAWAMKAAVVYIYAPYAFLSCGDFLVFAAIGVIRQAEVTKTATETRNAIKRAQ